MYYILINGEQRGPYSLKQLHMMWATGAISANDLCWTEGMNSWEAVELHIDKLSNKQNPKSDQSAHSKIEYDVHGNLFLSGRSLVPASGLQRLFGGVIDIVWIGMLVVYITSSLGLNKDPASSVVATLIMLLGAVAKDVPFRGRSLGRLLSRTYLIDLRRKEMATIPKSVCRNGILALWMLGPWILILGLSAFIPAKTSIPILEHALAVGSLTYYILVIVSCNNETRQGCWDQPTGTCVMRLSKKLEIGSG